ncbi:Protein piccolo [Colletotrichum aenigma]|uniref:Protein piccolo n=1 Tax=Colletotrichum aenigma TaxID=1215731 RepID=UPI001872D4E5|nr:Protein piccolo [Colletotrichum aenigma]KAF5519583.1 Protein piccolo [Colletotrichum aenigma]
MSDLNKLVPDPTKRYNPLIKPTDAAWKEVEYTFRRMLDRPTLTIKQVLDDHFTPHERKLFLPAVEPRSLRECQEDSTRRYRALLAGRFKGHFPSLATKFAMLYFGLPVEPALSQFAQLSKPSFEIDDWEQLHEAEVSPPLHFLTAHDRRNFGYDHLRGTEAPYSTIPVPSARFRGHSGVTGVAQDDSESQGLNLRGGGNDDDDDDDDEEMPDLYHHPRASVPPIPETPYVESSGYLGRRTPPAQVLPQSTPSILSTKHIIRNDELRDLQHHPRTSIPPIPETPYVESSGYQPRQRPPPKATPTISSGKPRVSSAATPSRLEVPTPAGVPGGRYQTAASTILPARAPGSSASTPATARPTSVPRGSSNNPTFGPGTSTSAIGTGLGSTRLPGVGSSSHQVPPTSNPVSNPASFAIGTGLNNQPVRANSSQGLPGSSSIVAATGGSQGRTPATQHFKPSSVAGTGRGKASRTPGFAPPSMPNASDNQESASAYSGYGDPTPRSPAKNLAELFGFQGRVTFDAANLSTLEQASRKLLSLKQRDQSDMVLDHMNRKDKSVVRSFNTKIPLPSTGDLVNYVNEQSKTNQDCVWFVRRQGETTPTHWAPTDSDYTNHMVRLSRTNDFGGSDFAYYTVPRRGVFFGAESQSHALPSTFPWGANQYMPFLTTAQEVLIGRPQIPGGSHCDIVLSGEHEFQKSYQNHWYGGLEIDYYFWLAMHPHVIRRTPTNITSEALPEDSVVFYLPGSRLNASTRELRKCSHKAGAKDPYEDALRTMENLMRVSHMPVKASKYRIWRGTDFFSHIIYPTRAERRPAEWHHLDQTARQQDQQNLSRFITDSVNDEREPCRLFVIQPVDGDVTCRMVSQEWNNGHQDFNVDSHAMATFKSKVRKLYEGCPNIEYDPEKHSILLQPLIPRKFANDWNPAPFILRPNDPDNQLAMIRRRIIAEEVQISILQDDKLDFVKQLDRSEWGPRYGDVTRFRDELGLPLISLAREDFPHPPDERPEKRVHEENAREKTWSKQPSVFDRGIYNPSIPINAPPIEAIMRTGGSDTNLYLFNKNVLTATEQRDLQELGWKYRNMILDRQNGCPFEKCKYDYRQGKDVEFVRHLKESHVDNKCPWCDVQLFTHWTLQQREEHMKEKHAAQLRKILNMPDPRPATRKPTVAQSTSEDLYAIPSTILGRLQPPKGPLPKLSPPPRANGKESEYRYCDRCGRDHHVLNDRDERDHHDRTCVPHAEAVGRCTFCETCGDAVWNNKEVRDEFAPYDEYPHRCRGTSHSKKPFCNKCGFSLRKLSDEKIDRHRQHCGGFFAHVGCFCPYCQKNFVVDGKQEDIETIKKHIIDCPDKKPPNITPFEIYPEGYWKDSDQPTDPLYIGSNATRDLVRRQPRRPAPNRFLSYPLAWHDKPGPSPVQDPPAECTIRGCLEPLFGLTPSEVLVHYETKHGGMPLKQCPLCRLDFRVPEEERKANENLPEIQARIFQVRHMECHVYELWKILEDKDIPHIPQREPFGPGHSMWDPDNERAVDRRDKRCPYFERCGAMVGFMNQRQLNHHMETAHGAEDFVIGRQPNREAELARLREERKKQRIREGKQPIPGTNTGAQSGPPGTASTDTGLFEQPDNSRPGGRRDVNRPQESQPVTDPMQGVEIGESQIPPSGQRTPPYGPRECQGANTGGHSGGISGGGGGNDGGGSSSNPPKVVDPSTTKPVTTKPTPSKPVPSKPTPSKPTPSKPVLTKPVPTKPTPSRPTPSKPTSSQPTSEPTVKPPAKPRPPTRPKPVGPVPVPRNDVPTSGFVPDDDMYCSRCFRKAPKRGPRGIKRGDPDRQAQVDAHSDPNRSCRIPAKEGTFEVDEEDWPVLPSRVGWIKQPKNVRLSKLKADFLDEHPELAKTMCPTDGSKRTNLTWQHDPNHNDNKDNWRLPFPGDDDDGEDDEDEDEDGVNENADGNFINDEEDDDEDEEYYEEVEDADGNKTIRRKTRGVRSMGLPRDETWKDTGEEDDLSVANSSDLVPETASGDEAPSNTGDKRKRDETDAQGRAGSPKKTRVVEDEDELGDA